MRYLLRRRRANHDHVQLFRPASSGAYAVLVMAADSVLSVKGNMLIHHTYTIFFLYQYKLPVGTMYLAPSNDDRNKLPIGRYIFMQ
jgi:hypothetical protein